MQYARESSSLSLTHLLVVDRLDRPPSLQGDGRQDNIIGNVQGQHAVQGGSGVGKDGDVVAGDLGERIEILAHVHGDGHFGGG